MEFMPYVGRKLRLKKWDESHSDVEITLISDDGKMSVIRYLDGKTQNQWVPVELLKETTIATACPVCGSLEGFEVDESLDDWPRCLNCKTS